MCEEFSAWFSGWLTLFGFVGSQACRRQFPWFRSRCAARCSHASRGTGGAVPRRARAGRTRGLAASAAASRGRARAGRPASARPGPRQYRFSNLIPKLFLKPYSLCAALLEVPLSCICEWLFHKTPRPFYVYCYGYLFILFIVKYGFLGHHNPWLIFLIHNIQETDPEINLTINSLQGQ